MKNSIITLATNNGTDVFVNGKYLGTMEDYFGTADDLKIIFRHLKDIEAPVIKELDLDFFDLSEDEYNKWKEKAYYFTLKEIDLIVNAEETDDYNFMIILSQIIVNRLNKGGIEND